ncbi:MAG TPA: hypothetical protein VEJ46_01670, partial [Candidatus Acidoferrum sp.]|nr:hypothetical protein [Candidatus Acidoferrum sp.]
MMSERQFGVFLRLLPLLALVFFHAIRANGNVTFSGGKSFTYDSQNQMIAMMGSGTAVSMVYDAFGNRVAKSVGGVVTRYLVEDEVNPTGYPQVFDELTNGVVSRTYTYGLQRISEEQQISSVWTPSFYGYDGGGSVRNLTDVNGVVTDQYEYDAFGNSFTVSGTTPNSYLYRGEQFDSDLGLYYLRASSDCPTPFKNKPARIPIAVVEFQTSCPGCSAGFFVGKPRREFS